MQKKKSNVERLVEAGVLDDSNLDAASRRKINRISLSDQEIKILKDFKDKLRLAPLQLKLGPNVTVLGSL